MKLKVLIISIFLVSLADAQVVHTKFYLRSGLPSGLLLTSTSLNGEIVIDTAGITGTGTVTSVDASGGTTGFSFTGGPITGSGILTMSGVLSIANGGTNATTANAALNNLLPPQGGNSGKFLTTNGTNASWATVPGSGNNFPPFPNDTTVFLRGDSTWAAAPGSSGMAIGNTVSGSTSNSVLFVDSSGLLAQDHDYFRYDSAEHLLHIADDTSVYSANLNGIVLENNKVADSGDFSFSPWLTFKSNFYNNHNSLWGIASSSFTDSSSGFQIFHRTDYGGGASVTLADYPFGLLTMTVTTTGADANGSGMQIISGVSSTNYYDNGIFFQGNQVGGSTVTIRPPYVSPPASVEFSFPDRTGDLGDVLFNKGSGQSTWKPIGDSGGVGSVTSVSTTLSGITIDDATTTPKISGTLGISSGGTGETTASAAFQALAPLATLGDMLYSEVLNIPTRLPGVIDPILHVLTQTGNGLTSEAPAWMDADSLGIGSGTVASVAASGGTTGLSFTGSPITTSGTLTQTGTLNETHGGTNQTTYSTGDILYASGSNTLAKRSIGSTGDVLTVSGGVPVWAAPTSGGIGGMYFGDGSDGTVIFDGSTTILGLAPVATVYTLTRDLFLDSMTVNVSTTVKTNGFRVYGKGLLANNGTIQNGGNDATGTTGGAGTNTSGSIGFGRASSNGNIGTGNGVPGNAPLIAAAGGNGGNGGAAGGNAGASGGTVIAPAASQGGAQGFRSINTALTGYLNSFLFSSTSSVSGICGGASGACGAANGGGNGGAGGGGAGVMIINFYGVNNTGTISCDGGFGSVGTAVNSGGSGGGGGGLLYINTHSYTNSGGVHCTGGTASSPTGTGSAGSNGSDGNVCINIF